MKQATYLGPRVKRLRRELGLTQAQLAADLGISDSYVALIERNQRPVTADLLLRLAATYRLDLAALASGGAEDDATRLAAVLRDPLLAGVDVPAIEVRDVAANYPGITEAMVRLHTALSERMLALADAEAAQTGAAANDPVAQAQHFIAARRNCFPALDEAAEDLAAKVEGAGGMERYIADRFEVRVRTLPSDVMMGAQRRYDRHREELWIDETLDGASHRFQVALQLAWLALRAPIEAAMGDTDALGEEARVLIRRALGGYAAAALRLPYTAFARDAEGSLYDLDRLARRWGASFEQVAHRLTTLQKPRASHVPFFFLRVDIAGNVSKRLDGAGFPFARHGGACPLWNVHAAFREPRRILTQWLELPDGKRFFSIARTVTSGGGQYGAPLVERVVALGTAASEAHRLIYTRGEGAPDPERPTPIGPTCRLCDRTQCPARAHPPLGRALLPDDSYRGATPWSFAEG